MGCRLGTGAAAVLLFAVGFVFYQRDNRDARNQVNIGPVSKIKSQLTRQSQIEQDNELMSQVNSEIAEAVPAPMQPLRLSESTVSSTSTAK